MDTTTASVDQFCAGLKVAAKESCLGQAHLYEQTYYWKSAALLLALAAERDALREALVKSRKDCVEKISRIPAGDYDSCLDRMMRRFNAALKEPT